MKKSFPLLVTFLLLLYAIAAFATPVGVNEIGGINLTGNLALDGNGNPNGVDVFVFNLQSSGTVTIQSWGFGGTASAANGTDLAGVASSGGEMALNLTLFGADGTGIADSASYFNSNGDACPPADLNSDFLCGDPQLSVASLDAGTYYLAVISGGNSWNGTNLIVGSPAAAFNLDGGSLLDFFGTPTLDAYDIDVFGDAVVGTQLANVPPAPAVPEPAPWLLLATGLLLLGAALPRLRSASVTAPN